MNVSAAGTNAAFFSFLIIFEIHIYSFIYFIYFFIYLTLRACALSCWRKQQHVCPFTARKLPISIATTAASTGAR
jgi:hypothetical protein